MIICKSCCKNTCEAYSTCMVNLKAGYPATCEVCGKEGPCLECRSEVRSLNKPSQDVNRFLSLLRPVAETLSDREAKYGGAYQKLRKQFEDAAPLEWEITKKLYRYKEAMKRSEYETAWDSLVDIAGYCVLEMEVLKEGQPIRAKLRVEEAVPKVVEPEEYRKEGTD